MQPQYDQASAQDIERFGKRLVGKTLRTVQGVRPLSEQDRWATQGVKTKGSLGGAFERYYGINPGNASTPDFSIAGVELKGFPLKKHRKGGHQAKERLVLGLINYLEEADRDFWTSSLMAKCQKMMMLGYLYSPETSAADFKILLANLLEYKDLPEAERKIIEADWDKIHSKIAAGKAHEISEGDTLLLAACTKSATSKNRRPQAHGGPEAKPRAYSFKGAYLTRLIRRFLNEPVIGKDEESFLKKDEEKGANRFESIVISRFDRFIGKSVEEIHAIVGGNLKKGSKGYLADLSRRMMGVEKRKIVEFENAEISMKTIQLTSHGTPKEDMSFPTFDYKEILDEKWDGDEEDGEVRSEFQRQLEKRFFFVVFQCGGDCKKGDQKRLKEVRFWNMPEADLEDARKTWEETVRRIREGDIENLPKGSETRVAHVRPHGRDGSDKIEAADGKLYMKKCFWLNKAYLKEQVK